MKSKPNPQTEMGRQEWESRCRKHPKHRELKGVCPSCLRERLNHLSAASSVASTAGSTSSGSTASSPSGHLSSRSQPLDKSRSLAALFGLTAEEVEEKEKHSKVKLQKTKKGSFWSKIMARKEDGLFHSRTVKEKGSTKWVLF